MCSACAGSYEDPDMTAVAIDDEVETTTSTASEKTPLAPHEGQDCPICGSSLCAHGYCRDLECVGSVDSQGWQCQDCAEAQHERWLEDFYGGDGPQTDREREEVRRMQR